MPMSYEDFTAPLKNEQIGDPVVWDHGHNHEGEVDYNIYEIVDLDATHFDIMIRDKEYGEMWMRRHNFLTLPTLLLEMYRAQ